MAKKEPTGRRCRMFGTDAPPDVRDDGTWCESEVFCYPGGGMHRRAYVTCPDGRRRIVMVGVPDTFFSAPARMRAGGRSVKGFISTTEGGKGYIFTPNGAGASS